MSTNGAKHRRFHSASAIRPTRVKRTSISGPANEVEQGEINHHDTALGHDRVKGKQGSLEPSGLNGHVTSDQPQTPNGQHRAVNGGIPQKVNSPPQPIAICGMALRLPGGLSTPAQFWDFLVRKGDARSRVPESRYNISGYQSSSGKPGSIKTEHGYFLDESTDLGALDASFFSMTKAELERADPHHRQMLEVARECLESAGVVDWRGKPIGCYMGSFGEDWSEMFAKEPQQYGLWRVTGYGDFMLSNRVSYEMDLKGPSMTIRTGCSAALIALHEACQAVERGDCSSAIVGGANLIMAPGITTAMTEQGVLSPDGSCKTFSADADGYARGEAINAIFIKPLNDALRDGNPIRAVIRSTATNSDGKTPGISCPSTEAHEAMIRRAYKVADLDFAGTAFVECHGTGTSIGDPIEASAVGRVFSDSGGVYIGSAKPNVGHSEGASGLTSLIKVVLALENRVIPPNIKFSKPNPKIPFHKHNLRVPTEPTAWPRSRCERASVNSFGIGGSNAHAIIDSAASFHLEPPIEPLSDTPQLLVYSANSQESLRRHVANHQRYIEEHPTKLADLAYTLANRREHLSHRAFSVTGVDAASTVSPFTKVGQSPEIVMIFTGQGAQWPQMGRELIESNAVFRKSIRSMDKTLQGLPHPPVWRIESELLKPPKTSQLHKAELSQPLLLAMQIALIDTLASIGVEASSVIGHSSGEIAAAYAAGGLTAREAIIAASARGVITKHQKKNGGMAAIGMGWDDTVPYLVPGVVIACENSPSSVTISGDRDKLDDVVAAIQKAQPEIMARVLKVDQAYHSYHMIEIGNLYHRSIEDRVIGREPTKRFFSSLTGNLIKPGDVLGARYWQKNLESPVLFRTAVASLVNHRNGKNLLFLEVGPHGALAGPLRQTLTQLGVTAPYVPAMIRNKDSSESFLSAIGQLYVQNVPIDFKTLMPRGCVLTDLPTYPWNHDSTYWYESRLSKEWRQRKFPHHDLLGARLAESTDFEPSWRNLLHLDNAGWIRDHKIRDDIIFPFAGYVGMVGEAVRQLSGVEEGFSLKHVVVSTALVLGEGKPTEIITSLKHYRLTDSLDSHWWEFSIASHNGSSWTKHCTGQVKPQAESVQPSEAVTALPRRVETLKWYETMRWAGLNYGPQFQGLTDISASTTSRSAAARTINTVAGDRTDYPMHPTTIDFFLQLMSVAVAKGISRNFRTMAVPTSVEELSIYRCRTNVDMKVFATASPKGVICGGGECVSDGRLVLKMSGMKLSPLEEEASADMADSHAAARLEWRPDIDFSDVTQLIKPSIDAATYGPNLDELTQLCVLETKYRLARLSTNLSHLARFRSWLDSGAQAITYQSSTMKREATRLSRINELESQLSTTPAAIAATAMLKILDNICAIYSGTIEPLEVLLADGVLTKLYNFMDECDRTAFIQLLAHNKPNLRVLEIGAGTGGTTNTILKDLTSQDGRPMYSKYTFTDISAGFFVAAKERFKASPNMEFATLDISKDPTAQGFEEGSYDLILATNVLHATKSLGETLTNVRSLLHTDGRLLMQELCANSKWTNYIMGVLPGWWLGEADGRPDEPYVSPERWESELVKAGFKGLDATILDAAEPFHTNAIMVAKPKEPAAAKKSVTLLYEDGAGLSTNIYQALLERGFQVSTCTLYSSIPQDRDVIALLDIENPFFEDIQPDRFDSFKKLTASLGDAGVFWITRSSQMHCQDPRWGQTIGAARAVRSEMSIDFATCEVDDMATSLDKVLDVFEKFNKRRNDETIQPDLEYAICEDIVHVGRYHPCSVISELVDTATSDCLALDVGKYGRLSTLHWSQKTASALIGDEVEVETCAVGLNFRDILIAMGIVDGSKDSLGLEAAGIVRRLGPQVKNLDVGDRVVLFGTGCFSTLVTTSELLCAKMPDNLNFDDGATMPCVYGTVIYSFIDVGRLEKGQSVLIHSACGGVGISAIQIARMLGAEIYVTVGNEEKVQYLMTNFNVPRNRIFNSRDASFLTDLMRETDGKGVDLVLNSLSGELLHTSWQCVAEFGKMIEIGKRDIIGAGKLDMSLFLANRSYCCVDLGEICNKKPEICNRLLKLTMKFFQEGHIQPIRPIKTFPAASIQDCFRYMQKGTHIGKIVVSMSDITSTLEATGSRKKHQLDPAASYLLVGGLGGLGRIVSNWMIEQGARHLIYLSRNAGADADDQAFLQELASQDCRVQVVQGSVSKFSDVRRAMKMAQKPIRGILQMSMVLRDQSFPKMTHQEWKTVVEPKVRGTYNLHKACTEARLKLDFFVMFGSISGVIGQPGQVNYASANTFLDAFVQFRRGLNLPASTIDIGMVEDSGYVAQNAALLNRLKAAGAHGLREPELLNALMLAMLPPSAEPRPRSSDPSSKYTSMASFVLGLRSTIPLSDVANRAVWKRDRRMAAYHNSAATTTSASTLSTSALQSFLATVAGDPALLKSSESSKFLAREIGRKLFDFLLKPEEELDISHSLADVGMDSLVAIEMRSWWKQAFGFDISVLEMLGMGSIEALGKHAAEGVMAKLGGGEEEK